MVLHVVEKRDGTVEVLGRAREVEEYGTQCERIVLVGLLPGCRDPPQATRTAITRANRCRVPYRH